MKSDERIPAALRELSPDILVVPESSSCPKLAQANMPHRWSGKPMIPLKGLGIFAPTAQALSIIGAPEAIHQFSLAVRVVLGSSELNVLGVWTLPSSGGGYRSKYLNSLNGILQERDDLLLAGNVVVAGDFNTSGSLDPQELPELFESVRDRYGLISAYHRATGEALGSESKWTHWHRGKADAGFHIDFVLIPEVWALQAVSVGVIEQWGSPNGLANSDHAPLTVDFSTS